MVWLCQPPDELLATGYIPQVFLRQLPHEVKLGGVFKCFPRTVTLIRRSQNDAGLLKSHQVPIQTGPRNPRGLGQLSCSTWAHESETSEDFGLSAAPNHGHHSFNLRREVGINEGGHLTIMPDASDLRRVIAQPYY
jgi:hypothetical protein